MDNTLEEVQKHCSKEINAYAACVDSNPKNWQTKCQSLREALSKCSEDNVAVLKQIRQKCQPIIDKYRNCLTSNPQKPEECMEELRSLYNCTQMAGAEAEAKKDKN